jgi:hypothetical protein
MMIKIISWKVGERTQFFFEQKSLAFNDKRFLCASMPCARHFGHVKVVMGVNDTRARTSERRKIESFSSFPSPLPLCTSMKIDENRDVENFLRFLDDYERCFETGREKLFARG